MEVNLEAHIQILNALVEMVKQGGYYAIWGIAIYLITGLVKLSLILWVSYSVIQQVLLTLGSYMCLKFVSNKDKITLLSNTSMEALTSAIQTYQTSTEAAMRSFTTEAKDLLMKSKESQEKNGNAKIKPE